MIVLHSFWVQKSKDIALAALDEHPSLKEWIYLTAGLSKRLMETIARDVPDPNALPPSIVSAIFHAAIGLSLLINLSPGTEFDPAARPALLELLQYLSQRWRLASELDSRPSKPSITNSYLQKNIWMCCKPGPSYCIRVKSHDGRPSEISYF